jgi:rubrerythrin
MKIWEELSKQEQDEISNQIARQNFLKDTADISYDAWSNGEWIADWWLRNLKPLTAQGKFYFCKKCNEKYAKNVGRVCPICKQLLC